MGAIRLKSVSTVPDWAPEAPITNIASSPSDAATVYVMWGTPGYDATTAKGYSKLMRTTDYGQTWEDLSGFAGSTDGHSTAGLPDLVIYDLLVVPGYPHKIWLATEAGLYESRDNGTTWRPSYTGIPPAVIWRLEIIDDQIVALTHGAGIWTIDQELVDSEYSAPLPSQLTLPGNYPNPFATETTINFALPESGHVTLSVYDLLGRRVSTIADKMYAAGRH